MPFLEEGRQAIRQLNLLPDDDDDRLSSPPSTPAPPTHRPIRITRPITQLPTFVNRRPSDVEEAAASVEQKSWLAEKLEHFDWSVNERAELYLLWSFVVSVACLYNLVFSTILVYDAVRADFYTDWIIWNAIADSIYLLDMLVQSRKNFYHDGVKTSVRSAMWKRYVKRHVYTAFVLDILSILPTDILLALAPDVSLLRCNRFFKGYRLNDTIQLIELRTVGAIGFTLLKLILVCLLLFHWNACAYFSMSKWSYTVMESVDEDDWPFTFERVTDVHLPVCGSFGCSHELFDEEGRDVREREEYAEELEAYWANRTRTLESSAFAKEYSQTFYWSSLTMTTLGEQPSPNLSEHNLLEIFDTLVGILIFAVIMGSVADVVADGNKYKSAIQDLADGLRQYMSYRKLDAFINHRILGYCQYKITSGSAADEEVVRQEMPSKLFLRVNPFLQPVMLEGSQLFKGLDIKLLREIASKLRLQSFVPHDQISVIGDWNKEMYMLCSGTLAVYGKSGGVIRVLKAQGDIVGDSTLIWFKGDRSNHRRTFSIVSIGFSEVYTLHRTAFRELLNDYPEDRDDVVRRARGMQRTMGLLPDRLVDEDVETRTFRDRVMAANKGLRMLSEELEMHTRSLHSTAQSMKRRVAYIERLMEDLLAREGRA